jgi:hypothetical protein
MSVLSENPARQVWAIERPRATVDDLPEWRAAGLTNKVHRFFQNELRLEESSFYVLLGELEQLP